MTQDTPASPEVVRRTRRLIGVLGGGALLLAGALASMPWLATRPRPAPDVRLTLLDGTQPRIADLRGRVVLMSFWSTTCAPCIEEMPMLIEFHRRNAPRGLKTIAVAMQYDRPEMVLDMSRRRQFPFDVAFDVQGDVAQAFFRTEVTPSKYLIDPQGSVVRTYVGATDFSDLQQRIDGMLRGPG